MFINVVYRAQGIRFITVAVFFTGSAEENFQIVFGQLYQLGIAAAGGSLCYQRGCISMAAILAIGVDLLDHVAA